MTKFVDFNVFTKNFFNDSMPELPGIDTGKVGKAGEFPVLEEYIPED